MVVATRETNFAKDLISGYVLVPIYVIYSSAKISKENHDIFRYFAKKTFTSGKCYTIYLNTIYT